MHTNNMILGNTINIRRGFVISYDFYGYLPVRSNMLCIMYTLETSFVHILNFVQRSHVSEVLGHVLKVKLINIRVQQV